MTATAIFRHNLATIGVQQRFRTAPACHVIDLNVNVILLCAGAWRMTLAHTTRLDRIICMQQQQ